MEKEQKKLLLVAVSVGVFLLVTITVAIVVLTPKVQPHGTAFSSSIPIQPAGRIQPVESSNIPLQPIINNTQETNIIIDGNPDTSVALDRDNGDSLTILIPRPNAAAVPETPAPSSAVAARPATPPAETRPVQTAPAQTTAAAQRPAAQPAATPRTTTPARTTTARTTNDYWIQTGAFSAIIRAEDARELLASKGLTSIIENREIDGRVWYRVRLGPYTSEREANYWLSLVKAIDGFGESQIRQTTRQL